MRELNFNGAMPTKAHYSPAIMSADEKTVYISGQLPLDVKTRELSSGDIREQTRLALSNMEDILKTVGLDRKNLIRTTAYIDDMDNWDAVNEVYADFFKERKPARTIVCVPAIHFGLKIEIDGVAEREL